MWLPLALALALGLALPGCADLAGHAPSEIDRCRAARVVLFREDSATGNLTLPVPANESFTTLLSAGVWTRAEFAVAPQSGKGNWTALASALHNLTLDDVKTEFERGVSPTTRQTNVTYAVRRTLGADEYAGLCRALTDLYPSIPTSDTNPACASSMNETALFRVYVDAIERDRSVTCGGGTNASSMFVASLDAVKANDPPRSD